MGGERGHLEVLDGPMKVRFYSSFGVLNGGGRGVVRHVRSLSAQRMLFVAFVR